MSSLPLSCSAAIVCVARGAGVRVEAAGVLGADVPGPVVPPHQLWVALRGRAITSAAPAAQLQRRPFRHLEPRRLLEFLACAIGVAQRGAVGPRLAPALQAPG